MKLSFDKKQYFSYGGLSFSSVRYQDFWIIRCWFEGILIPFG
jgi:hypothetical protein